MAFFTPVTETFHLILSCLQIFSRHFICPVHLLSEAIYIIYYFFLGLLGHCVGRLKALELCDQRPGH